MTKHAPQPGPREGYVGFPIKQASWSMLRRVKHSMASDGTTRRDFRCWGHCGPTWAVRELPSIWYLNAQTRGPSHSHVSRGEREAVAVAARRGRPQRLGGDRDATCCTVAFPPFRMAMPSFSVAATIGPVSPTDTEKSALTSSRLPHYPVLPRNVHLGNYQSPAGLYNAGGKLTYAKKR